MAKLRAVVIVGAEVLQVDVIEHDGKNWLVPEWLDYKFEGYSSPTRIVWIDLLAERLNSVPQFVVSHPIPTAVFYGPIPSKEAEGYVVILQPDIRIPLESGRN